VTVIRKVLQLRTGRLAVILLAMILLLAVFGPLLAPYDPLAGTASALADPSWSHPFGTDYLGRDVFSRILAGSPLSVLSAVQVAVIALVVGAVPGILSVYLGRVFEWFTLRLADTLIALPFLVFAVAMAALLGNGISQAMLAVGILVAPVFYRVARAATLSVSRSQYVEAAILGGASTSWIVRKHVWSKVLPPIAIALANTMGAGLVVVASLTFLGIGVQPPTPTWGGILASDLGYLSYQAYAPLFPTALIMITVWAFNMLADAIRDVAGQSGRVLLSSGGRRTDLTVRSGAGTAEDDHVDVGSGEPARGRQDPDALLQLDRVAITNRMNGAELVHGVTFSLAAGEVVGVVGESGSGKTLTCRSILGILPERFDVSSGSVRLFGQDVSELTQKEWTQVRGASISAVFQDPASYLNPSIRVGKQIEEVLRVRTSLRRGDARARVLELFELVRLHDPEYVYQQYPHEMSGGMLQRVLIASAIALEPRILIADEATTALDVTVQAEILDLLIELKDRIGLSLLVVSHDLAVVARLCDEVLVMRAGDVVEQGATSDILFNPQHEYTRLLIDEHNLYGIDRFIDSEVRGNV
jgi:peptide/nickel transport system permease protein